MRTPSLTDRTLGSMAWMLSGTGAQAILRAVVLLVLARLLTPEAFGIVAAALVVVNFSNIVAQLGVGQALLQRERLTDLHVRTGFTLSVATGAAFTGLVWLASPAIAAFFAMPSLLPVLRLLSVTFLLKGPSVTARVLLQRELRFRQLAVIETASFLVGFALVGVVLAAVGLGVWALAIAHMAHVVVQGGVLLAAQRHAMRPSLDRAAARDLLRMGSGFTVGKFFNYLALQSDYLVVGRWLGGAALGVYSRAYELMVTPAVVFGKVADSVLFPVMAQVQSDAARLETGYRRGLAFAALVSMPAGIGVAVVAPELVWLLLGERWMDVVLPLRVLALGMFFRTSYKISESVLRATGAVYARAWRQGVYAAAVFGGAWIGQEWGLGGVATGVLAAIALNFALMTERAAREVDVGLRAVWGVHAPLVLLSAAVGLATGAATLATRGVGAHPAWVLIAAVAAGGAIATALGLAAPTRTFGPEGGWVMARVFRMLGVTRWWPAAWRPHGAERS